MNGDTPFEQVVHYTCTECKETYDIDYLEKDTDLKTICPICGKLQRKHDTSPAPDLLALLKQCKPWLEEYKFMLAPDRPQELINLLSDIAKAEARNDAN